MKKSLSVLCSLFLFILVLTVVHVVISNRLATTGFALGKYQEEINEYRNQNSVLTEKLLIASSLSHIASSAAELGFVEGQSPIFLSTPLPLAVKR